MEADIEERAGVNIAGDITSMISVCYFIFKILTLIGFLLTVLFMAKKTLLIDDFDETTTEGVETIQFAVGNNTYQIDLNEQNRKKLDKALAPFVEKATPVRNRGTGAKRPSVPAKEIREWAKQQSEQVSGLLKSDRGALPKPVISAYNEAHGTKY